MRTKSSFMNVKWEAPVKMSIRLSASREDACQVTKAGTPAKPNPRKTRDTRGRKLTGRPRNLRRVISLLLYRVQPNLIRWFFDANF